MLDREHLGVLDFGDLTSGDPAVDLRVLWLLLDADHRTAIHDEFTGATPYDVHVWTRARGWAASFVLAVAADERSRVGFAPIITHALVALGS